MATYLVVYVDGVETDRREVAPGTWATDDFQAELSSAWSEYEPDAEVRVRLETD